MTKFLKVTAMAATCAMAFCADVAPEAALGLQFLPDANAVVGAPRTPVSVAGVARRTTRRVVVASSTTSSQSSAQAATAEQQSATAEQQSATAAQQSATAQQQTAAAQQPTAAASPAQAAPAQAAPAPAGQALALGTVVPTLPAGCTQVTSGGVQYSKCGANYYRAVFQGNNLVYVTAQP